MTRPLTYPRTTEAPAISNYVKRIVIGLLAGVVISVVISAGVWALAVGIPWKLEDSQNPIATFCEWLYNTWLSVSIRESVWVFPAIEGSHLLGIALSAGALCWFDLRLLGLALRNDPVSAVWKHIMPVAFVGFGLVFITGSLLFIAEARTAYHSFHFWIKMVLIVVAGANALLFEFKLHPRMHDWDGAAVLPMSARMAGVISLVLWTAIIVTGRTMAYTF
jgi:uncharacterized protein DUF6644